MTVDPHELIKNALSGSEENVVQFNVRKFSEVKAEKLEWYEKYWLPVQGLSGLAGPAGVGKSTMFVHEIAKLTTGQYGRDPINVAYFFNEDSESIIKARLKLAGADLERVLIIKNRNVINDSDAVYDTDINLKADLKRIQEALISDPDFEGVKALYLDPATSFLGVDEDKSAYSAIRIALGRLNELVVPNKLLIRLMKHTKKIQINSEKLPVASQVYGSAAWTEVPRNFSILWPIADRLRDALGMDEDDANVLMLKGKNNYAPGNLKAKAYKLDAKNVELDGDTHEDITYMEFLGARDVTDDEVNEANSKSKEEVKQDKQVSDKLNDAIKETVINNNGKIAKTDLYKSLNVRGFDQSIKTIDRRCEKMGLEIESIEGASKNAKQWIASDELIERWKSTLGLENNDGTNFGLF